MATEPSSGYRVEIPSHVREGIREWGRGRIGLRFRLRAALALHTILEELSIRPVEWGDPFRRWKQLQMAGYHRIIFPFYVVYGINEEHRLVFVHAIRPIIDAHPWWDLF